MEFKKVMHSLECNPVIAAVPQDRFDAALASPAEIIFHLGADLLSIPSLVAQCHSLGKYLFLHLDLTEGIGKDRIGLQYLAQCGVDGIISTKTQLIKFAKEQGLITVQRFFALDSKGMESIEGTLKVSNPHLMEIMPGVIYKAISRFSCGHIPVIAGGLIESKNEITEAISAGAMAVSTGKDTLWYI